MKSFRNLKHIALISSIALVLVFSLIGIFFSSFNDSINGLFIYRTGSGIWQDMFHKHALNISPDIRIVRIDDMSLNTLQAQGNLKMLRIPKAKYSELVEKLEWAGVKWIAFDIIFENADPDEKDFAETLKKYNNIVLATEYNERTTCIPDTDSGSSTCSGAPRLLYASTAWWMVNVGKNAFDTPTEQNISNMPYFKEKVSGKNSISRADSFLLPLSLQLYRSLGLSGTTLPIFMQEGIPYVKNPYFWWNHESNSFVEVLSMSRVDLIKNFAGKYVFIGESGTAIHDSIVSPVTGTQIDGVESHAHFLDWLLQNKMLAKLDTNIAFFLIVLLTIFSVCVYFFLPRFLSPVVAILFLVLILYISRYLYDRGRLLVDIFPLFLAGSILTYPVTYIYKFFVVEKEKRELQWNFSHYVDPTVVKQIADNGEDISLWGERREMTVFFSDIAGFTTISEKLDPTTLFYLMTSYLSNMTDILIREGWTLDKYIGDAVMGFFWAPLPDPLHPVHACRAALLMRQALPDFNKDISAHGVEPIDFRVGIASGEALVGNIGSKDRFNYTVLWDTVNLASRLEWTGKEYAVHIIISEWTREKIGDEFLLRELDTIAVKWKTEGVRIFELLWFAIESIDMTPYRKYEEALELYREGKYREAGEIWVLQMELDPPSRIMAERCVDIIKWNIHVENWVYHMTHK
jgi:class 3 adenylate cyclase/CHASE2 domain-containing sensor protein